MLYRMSKKPIEQNIAEALGYEWDGVIYEEDPSQYGPISTEEQMCDCGCGKSYNIGNMVLHLNGRPDLKIKMKCDCGCGKSYNIANMAQHLSGWNWTEERRQAVRMAGIETANRKIACGCGCGKSYNPGNLKLHTVGNVKLRKSI